MAPAYLIGINPPASLASELKALKRMVIEKCGLLPEVGSEPHITLNLNKFPNLELVDKELSKICSTFPPIQIVIDGLSTFPNIGSTTVVFAYVKPNPALQTLQELISTALAPLRDGEHLREYLKKHQFTDEQVRASERYGYPYIGKGWQPHMTIAFFDEKQFADFGQSLLNKPLKHKFVVTELTLFSWNSSKNNWQPYKIYPLKTK